MVCVRSLLVALALLMLSLATLAPHGGAASVTVPLPAPTAPQADFCDGNKTNLAMQCIAYAVNAAPVVGPVLGPVAQTMAKQYAAACYLGGMDTKNALCTTVDDAFFAYAHEPTDLALSIVYDAVRRDLPV